MGDPLASDEAMPTAPAPVAAMKDTTPLLPAPPPPPRPPPLPLSHALLALAPLRDLRIRPGLELKLGDAKLLGSGICGERGSGTVGDRRSCSSAWAPQPTPPQPGGFSQRVSSVVVST